MVGDTAVDVKKGVFTLLLIKLPYGIIGNGFVEGREMRIPHFTYDSKVAFREIILH